MKSGSSPSPFSKYGNKPTPDDGKDDRNSARPEQVETSRQSGQNTRSAGIDTAMMSTSSGRPIRQ
jgi:hypothetical protein